MRSWIAPLVVTVAELTQIPVLIEGLDTYSVVLFGITTLLTGMTYGFALAAWLVRR